MLPACAQPRSITGVINGSGEPVYCSLTRPATTTDFRLGPEDGFTAGGHYPLMNCVNAAGVTPPGVIVQHFTTEPRLTEHVAALLK